MTSNNETVAAAVPRDDASILRTIEDREQAKMTPFHGDLDYHLVRASMVINYFFGWSVGMAKCQK